jgi:hypothetical protein
MNAMSEWVRGLYPNIGGIFVKNRWAVYIDIQGFGTLWDESDKPLEALKELMRAIFRIGRQCYPNSPNRLFAHQFGDGFLVVSEFEERSLERCVTVAIAILRHVSVAGCFAKAAVVEGDMLDIKGWYPNEVMDNLDGSSVIDLGEGLMTITPVMGTALIQGVRLDKVSPKGPLLVIGKEKIDRLPQGLDISDVDGNVASINWITYQSELLSTVQQLANLMAPTRGEMEESIRRYGKGDKVPEGWVENANELLLSEQA